MAEAREDLSTDSLKEVIEGDEFRAMLGVLASPGSSLQEPEFLLELEAYIVNPQAKAVFVSLLQPKSAELCIALQVLLNKNYYAILVREFSHLTAETLQGNGFWQDLGRFCEDMLKIPVGARVPFLDWLAEQNRDISTIRSLVAEQVKVAAPEENDFTSLLQPDLILLVDGVNTRFRTTRDIFEEVVLESLVGKPHVGVSYKKLDSVLRTMRISRESLRKLAEYFIYNKKPARVFMQGILTAGIGGIYAELVTFMTDDHIANLQDVFFEKLYLVSKKLLKHRTNDIHDYSRIMNCLRDSSIDLDTLVKAGESLD